MSALVQSGPARVVAAGQVTGFFGHPLELRVDLSEGPLHVAFTFRDGPEVRADTRMDDTGWTVELTGIDDASGRGSAEPMLLGALGTDLLFLHFRAFRFGTTPDRTVHYTFFRVAKDSVGWRGDDEA